MVSENSKIGGEGSEASKHVRSFSEEEEIILMEEYLQFVGIHGSNVRNKWVEFLKNSSLNGKFGPRQIGKKMGYLERKFEKHASSPSSLPRHPHQARLFDLSRSLWGRREGKPPLVDDDGNGDGNKLDMIKPESTSAEMIVKNKKKKRTDEEDEWEADLLSMEVELLRQKLDLEFKECQLRSKRLNGPDYNFRTPSSEKKDVRNKVLRSIGSPVEPLALDFDINDNDSDEESDRSTKSMDGKQTSLENVEPRIDGGISGNEDIDGELGNEVTDMQLIDYVEEKSEIPQLCLPSCGGAEKDVDVESNVKIVTLSSGVVIKEIVAGDPTKRLAKKGRKVKVHTKGKVKGSDQYFESTRDLTVGLGSEQMIDGFSEGVEGMHVGGKRRLIIPPSMGYGDEGVGEVIPPNSWLEYEVELVSVLRSQKNRRPRLN